jgi:SAM-dependent methyltransferase
MADTMQSDSIDEAMRQACLLYAGASRWAQGYVRGKFSWDPVYRQLASRAPFDEPVIDLGCGNGQWLALLATLQPGLRATGFDWDGDKVKLARAATTQLPGIGIEQGDVRELGIDKAGTIFLIDVLHYLEPAAQDEVMVRSIAALAPGGRLYIRDVNRSTQARSLINRWQERVGRWIGLHQGAGLHFRPLAELTALLASRGVETLVVPSWGKLPLSNLLIEGRRTFPRDKS